jgi:hypothetical protein
MPGLQRRPRQAESGFAQVLLADGEELSSNPLCRFFNDLRITQTAVDVAWRIHDLLWRSPLDHETLRTGHAALPYSHHGNASG